MASSGVNTVDIKVPEELATVLKDLNKELLKAQPADIYKFCADHFNAKVAERQKAGGSPEVGTLAAQFGESSVGEEATGEEDDFFPSSEDEEEDEVAPAPPANYANRGRRTSVSAESMAPTSADNGPPPEKIVIPKSAEQRARIETSIRNNFLFKNLDEEQYNDVVDAMSEKKFGVGETVIKQGAVGDFFYVTESGSLDVFVSRAGGEPIKVASYGPNSSFGELALMYNAPRAATIKTTSESVLWALDRVTFRRILMDSTSKKRRYYESLLEDVPLLSSLEPYERHKIADALETVVFEDGDVVIRQGDVGENFYFIEQGDARVTVTDEAGTVYELKGLTKGNYFGELALLHDKPRVATVSAKGKLKVATLGKKAFVRLLGPVVDIIKRNETNYETIQKRVDAQSSGPGVQSTVDAGISGQA